MNVTALKLIFSKPAVLLLGAMAGLAGGAFLSRGCSPPPPSVGRVIQESTRTAPARDTRDWLEEETAPPASLVVQRPKAGDRQRIADAINRQDLVSEVTPETIEAQRVLRIITDEQAAAAQAAYAAEQERMARENHDLKDRILQFERELVARRDIPPSPWGGTVTATVHRITGKTDVDYQRRGRPRFNWLWDAGAGARYEWQDVTIEGLTSEATADQMEGRAYVFVEPLEIGKKYPVLVRLEAGRKIENIGDLRLSGWYAGVQAEVHFNRDRRVDERTATAGEE